MSPGMFFGRFGLDATNCGEWKKNCSPTENRSGPKYVLYPVGNSYCLGGRLDAALFKENF